jgi:hypothetical protein
MGPTEKKCHFTGEAIDLQVSNGFVIQPFYNIVLFIRQHLGFKGT